MKWVVLAALLVAGIAWSVQPSDTQLVFVMESVTVDGVDDTERLLPFRGALRYNLSGDEQGRFGTFLDPVDGGPRELPLREAAP